MFVSERNHSRSYPYKFRTQVTRWNICFLNSPAWKQYAKIWERLERSPILIRSLSSRSIRSHVRIVPMEWLWVIRRRISELINRAMSWLVSRRFDWASSNELLYCKRRSPEWCYRTLPFWFEVFLMSDRSLAVLLSHRSWPIVGSPQVKCSPRRRYLVGLLSSSSKNRHVSSLAPLAFTALNRRKQASSAMKSQTMIANFPEILCIQLKRYSYDRLSQRAMKLNTSIRIEPDKILDLSSVHYSTWLGLSKGLSSYRYRLNAVCLHLSGNSSTSLPTSSLLHLDSTNGHCVCLYRSDHQRWFLSDDERITEVIHVDHFFQSSYVTANCYLLFYERCWEFLFLLLMNMNFVYVQTLSDDHIRYNQCFFLIQWKRFEQCCFVLLEQSRICPSWVWHVLFVSIIIPKMIVRISFWPRKWMGQKRSRRRLWHAIYRSILAVRVAKSNSDRSLPS